jgi:hypothetical protein
VASLQFAVSWSLHDTALATQKHFALNIGIYTNKNQYILNYSNYYIFSYHAPRDLLSVISSDIKKLDLMTGNLANHNHQPSDESL